MDNWFWCTWCRGKVATTTEGYAKEPAGLKFMQAKAACSVKKREASLQSSQLGVSTSTAVVKPRG